MSAISQSSIVMQRTPTLSVNLPADEKWRVILARKRNFDGVFVFAVRSTGIYCKPSCPARRPSREQVTFFSGPEEAEESGFKPCRRCHPRETSPQVELINRICRYIEANLDAKLDLSSLSAHTNISPYHLQRTFKRVLGISPRQYVEACRLKKIKRSLRNGETVERALYESGFTSRSRLYEKVPSRLGVSPGTIRKGGTGLLIEYTIVNSPLGRLLIGATERGICAVIMGDSDAVVKASLIEDYPFAQFKRNDSSMHKWASEFMRYFSGQDSNLNLPVDVWATAFQWRVWKEIQSVPYGETTTYGKIAEAMGMPQAVRAVARACTTNPISLVVPCHRVIGIDGKLHGYRWGKKRKEALLALEQRVQSNLDHA